MEIIHVTGAEAARDFSALLAKVRGGAEVVIDDDVPVIIRAASLPRARSLSESLRIAEQHTRERGYDVTMDSEFAADLEERIRARRPRNTSLWD